MADRIQEYLDESLASLDLLLKHGLLSKLEARLIVKKRTSFEHNLNKLSTKYKTDFFRYMKYETNLSALIRSRMKANGIDQNKKLFTEISKTITVPITRIWKKAVRYFPTDVALWKQYFGYLGKKRYLNFLLPQAFADALRQNALQPDLWKLAANYEFQKANNVIGARNLYLRALRILGQSESMWVGYFQFEVEYLANTVNLAEKKVEDQEKPAVNPVGIDSLLPKEGKAESQQIDTTSTSFLRGDILKVIYRNATSKINTVQMRIKFAERAHKLTERFAQQPVHKTLVEIERTIIEDLWTKYPENPEALALIAQFNQTNGPSKEPQSAVTDTLDLLQNAVKKHNSAETWGAYLGACIEVLENSAVSDDTSDLIERTEKAFADCKSQNKFNEDIQSRFVSFLAERSLEAAVAESEAGIQRYPKCAPLWLQRITLEMKLQAQSGRSSSENIIKLFQQALKKNDRTPAAIPLWPAYLNYLLSANIPFTTLIKRYKEALSCATKIDLGNIREDFVEQVMLQHGISRAREAYQCSAALPPFPLELYRKAIEIEKSVVPADAKIIRKLYGQATDTAGKQNDDIWIEYLLWERDNGDLKLLSPLYWRAKKTLQNPTRFIQRLSAENVTF